MTHIYPSELNVVGGARTLHVGDIVTAIDGRVVLNYDDGIERIRRLVENGQTVGGRVCVYAYTCVCA